MNKRLNPLLIVVVVVIVIIAFLVWRNSSKPSPEAGTESPREVITERAAPVTSPAPESAPEPIPADEPTAAVPETTAPVAVESASPVVVPSRENVIIFRGDRFPVKSDLVLARVNFVDITLKNVQPVSETAPSEITVSAVEFKKNLERAIDREVILDTARRSNIQLDDEQRRLVEKSRLSAGAKGFSLPDNERPVHEAKSNFESLDLMSTLLSDGIAKASGGPAKDSVSDEEYQKYLRGMLDDLRKRNSIKVNAVIEAD